jgi:hypothetical protein
VAKRKLDIATEAALVEAIVCYSQEVAHLAVTRGSYNAEDYREEMFLRMHGFRLALLDVIHEGNKGRMSLRLYSWQPKVRGRQAPDR